MKNRIPPKSLKRFANPEFIQDAINIHSTGKKRNTGIINAETVLEILPDMIFVLDEKGQVLNYKADPDDLYYRGENIREILPETLSEQTLAHIAACLDTQKMQIFEYSLDIPGKGVRHYEARMVNNGRKILVVLVRDVTEQKNMETQLIEARNKAEELSRLKLAFLANMSHEIRTPMNAIIGFSNLLAKRLKDADAQKFAGLIRKSSNTLLHLIDDIILYSRLQSEKIPMKNSIVRPDLLLRDVCETFQLSEEERDIAFELQISPGCEGFLFKADEIKLRQILNNLISNAIKYSDGAGILLGCKRYGFRLCFYVEDKGCGIPRDELPHVFERFYRGDSVRETNIPGTGLGLSIVRELLTLMDGNIHIDSKTGKGTRMTFDIPLEIVAGPKASAPESECKFDCSSGKFRVLIAEDDRVNFIYLRELLKNFAELIDHADNGQKALEMVLQNSYNLIFMDIKMPLMNGLEVIAAIRQHQIRVPIIAQTAYAQPEEREHILAAGADAYLAKPILSEDLEQTIRKVWENQS